MAVKLTLKIFTSEMSRSVESSIVEILKNKINTKSSIHNNCKSDFYEGARAVDLIQ